jgi:hypothetical protein
MKIVWVLSEHHDYEGGEVVGCYDSVEAGMAAAGGEWNRDPWGRYVRTERTDTGCRYELRCYTLQDGAAPYVLEDHSEREEAPRL